MVDIWSAGNYGSEEDSTLRLARPLCFLRSDPTDNGYARPIEGLRPVVDLNRMQVIRVEEYGKWPLPPKPANYSADRVAGQRTDIKPLYITQPEGPSFSLQGSRISWQNWSLVIGFNAREGLTLHDVRYSDHGRARPILFRASLTEMVVPYGDPRPTQVRKNAFDVGEYGMGMCANSLQLGCDCVGHIEYLDAFLCDSRGRDFTIPNAICVHEEDYGILWKHTDRRLPDAPQVRRSRRLVISSISTVENYEYGFFWYFYQDGNIQFEIKLTGILSLGAAHEGETPKHGTMVAPLLYAPNHQHFFNVRLDVGIDGINNTVQQVDVVPDEIDEANPFENAFHVRATDLKTEQQALAHLNLESGRTWKFVNPSSKMLWAIPLAINSSLGTTHIPLLPPVRRGAARWLCESSCLGYPIQAGREVRRRRLSKPKQRWRRSGEVDSGRPSHRELRCRLLVTFGHTHIPRPEDCPVMPTAYIGFLLKPNGFFDENPGL